MINTYNDSYTIYLDRDFNIVSSGSDIQKNYSLLLKPGYLKNLLSCHGIDYYTQPVCMDCGGDFPGKKLLAMRNDDGLCCCLVTSETTYSSQRYNAISYQMREPISSIFALLPIIVNSINKDDDDKAILYLENIANQSYKLLRNVTNISLTNKLMNGIALLEESVDFSTLLENLVSSTLAVVKNISITTDIQPDVFIKGNRHLISTGILNIISNSILFRTDNKTEIFISLHTANGNAVFSYSDNSKGIRDEYQQMVFRPYFSKDPYADGSADPSLGLGLYITAKAFENSGGTVLLSSSFGNGVKYSASLPVITPGGNILKSSISDFLLNRYSDVFIQLCDSCTLPPLL